MVKLLCSNLDVLRQLFDLFSDTLEGVQVLKLATSHSQHGGLYKLLELYDVTPTYLSKVEAKVLFTLTLHAQVKLMFEVFCTTTLRVCISLCYCSISISSIKTLLLLTALRLYSLTYANQEKKSYHVDIIIRLFIILLLTPL